MRSDVAKILALSTSLALIAYIWAKFYYGCNLTTLSCHQLDAFGDFYGHSLRGSLFAGFLTLGGFLLSLKTFIVVNMKKEVFENDRYKQEWEQQKLLDTTGRLGQMFEPLRYLSNILFVAITCCVATAVLQLTIGLAETTWAAAICCWSALVSIFFLMRSLLLIRQNLNRMFDFLDPPS